MSNVVLNAGRERLFAEHNALIQRPNEPLHESNGWFRRYRYPVLTAAHTPLFWRYDLDPGTIEDIHTHFSMEQVASFHAFDDPERNVLVLFKLHPLPGGRVRDPGDQNLKIQLPDDKFDIPVQ